ncbi:MAG: DNA primase [Bowdeniella nasicola]|nr:DNA primase [Bowdeniella nasicola]
MATDPRAALDRLIAAFEAHYSAAVAAQDPDAPAVTSAAETLEDAFLTYDDALMTNVDVDVPLDTYGNVFDDDDEFDDDFDEDDDDEDDLDDDFDLDEDDEDD